MGNQKIDKSKILKKILDALKIHFSSQMKFFSLCSYYHKSGMENSVGVNSTPKPFENWPTILLSGGAKRRPKNGFKLEN